MTGMQGATSQQKKVLILTYYWPPSGGPGVQRILKIVKYLPELGWTPIILTVENGEYPTLDTSLLDQIPNTCVVYRTKTVEFFRLFKFLSGRKKNAPVDIYLLSQSKMRITDRIFTWIRQNIFIPDARLGWIPFAFTSGTRIIKQTQPYLIFSCSPPHSLQLSAYLLAKRSRLPWVADFRDPWTDAFWEQGLPRSPLINRLNITLEQKVVQKATALTTVSTGFKDLLLKKSRSDVYILRNGYDKPDFNMEKKPSAKFRIIYAGHISSSQNPELLFKALGRLQQNYGSLLDIHFYGKFDDAVLQSIEAAGVLNYIGIHAHIPHSEFISKIMNAEVLLLLIPNKHGKGIMTGKVYEYLGTRNFILGINNENEELANLLHECNCGETCRYDADPYPILVKQIEQWKAGIQHRANTEAIKQYERKKIAQDLVQIFERYI